MPSRKLHLKRLCLLIPPLVFAHLLLGITSPQLLAQEGDTRQESEGRRIYRLTYEAAMADSVITPDEDRMLTALQQALRLAQDRPWDWTRRSLRKPWANPRLPKPSA
ncbi:MAG: hypothetical protein IIB42_07360 [Candidatus Marinimicrobia bacterium]|nr:hypothetical protein [Candidatus Neomarinimicrobiota bacterium]